MDERRQLTELVEERRCREGKGEEEEVGVDGIRVGECLVRKM